MPLLPFHGVSPRLGARCFVAPSAVVAGDVEMGDEVSIWFGAVVRGDVNWIRIGAGSNVQDTSVLHVTYERHPLSIGRDVVIGHAAVVHGCTLGDGCLVGIGARVLDGAVVEPGAQVGAGAVVAPGTRIPSGQLALGVPARIARPLSDGERDEIVAIAARYRGLAARYRDILGDLEKD